MKPTFAETVTSVNIPECCRLGLDTCPHVFRAQKPKKGNIGL